MLSLRSAADVICHESTAGAQREGSKSLRQNHTLGISATATCSVLGTDAVLQTRKSVWKQGCKSVFIGRGDSCPKAGWPSELVWRSSAGSCTLGQATIIRVCLHLHTDLCIKKSLIMLASGLWRHLTQLTKAAPAKNLVQYDETGKRWEGEERTAQFRDRKGRFSLKCYHPRSCRLPWTADWELS